MPSSPLCAFPTFAAPPRSTRIPLRWRPCLGCGILLLLSRLLELLECRLAAALGEGTGVPIPVLWALYSSFRTLFLVHWFVCHQVSATLAEPFQLQLPRLRPRPRSRVLRPVLVLTLLGVARTALLCSAPPAILLLLLLRAGLPVSFHLLLAQVLLPRNLRPICRHSCLPAAPESAGR